MSKSKRTLKLERIQAMLENNGVNDFDAEVLAEDIYAIAHENGGSFTELEERVASMEGKYDVMSEKLDRVAKRLG